MPVPSVRCAFFLFFCTVFLFAFACPNAIARRSTFPRFVTLRRFVMLFFMLLIPMLFFCDLCNISSSPRLRRHGNLIGNAHHPKEFFHFLQGPLPVRLLASPEKKIDGNLVPFFQKFFRLFRFDLKIVPGRSGSNAHLLQVFRSLRLPLALLLFFPFIAELIEAHNPCNRRICRRRDFDKVEAFSSRDFQRLFLGNNPEVFSAFVDNPKLPRRYLIVDSIMDMKIVPVLFLVCKK